MVEIESTRWRILGRVEVQNITASGTRILYLQDISGVDVVFSTRKKFRIKIGRILWGIRGINLVIKKIDGEIVDRVDEKYWETKIDMLDKSFLNAFEFEVETDIDNKVPLLNIEYTLTTDSGDILNKAFLVEVWGEVRMI